MLWLALGFIALVVVYVTMTSRRMGPLFADAHLAQIAAALPELKQQALAGNAEQPASLRTSTLLVAYTVSHEEKVWIHHISLSSPVTPARAAGAFFLGLVRGLLCLEPYPQEAFVSQSHVFHLIVQLTEAEQQAFTSLSIEPREPSALRALAVAGRSALLRRLAERVVPRLPDN
jgi:hypothetical protein